jgi:hypothetical protein
MEDDLNQYLESNPCKGFRPVPHYFPTGDYVTFYVKDERCHAERVDDLLTVFLSNENEELIGCKIKGVRHLLDAMGTFGVVVQHEDVSLELFFVLGQFTARDPAQRRRYEEVIPLVKHRSIRRREILNSGPSAVSQEN